MTDGIKKAGGISFGVSMATDKLKRDVTAARKSIGGFVSSTQKSLGKLTSMFGGIGGALSVGSLAYGISRTMKQIDALNDSAKTLGVTTDQLSRLGFAANQSESSQESLIRGLQRVTRSTDDAARGVKEMADLYSSLGLNARDLAKLSPDKQFMKIGDAVRGLNNETAQLVAVQRMFGRGSADLVNVLRLTRTELEKLTGASDAAGLTIGQEGADRVAKAVDSWEKMTTAISGVGRELTISVAPLITNIADEAVRALRALRGMPGGNKGVPQFGKTVLPGWFGSLETQTRQRMYEWLAAGGGGPDEFRRPDLQQFIGKGHGLPQFDRFRQMQTGGGFDMFGAARRFLGPFASTPGQILSGLGGSKATLQRRLMGADFMARASGGMSQSSGGIANALRTVLGPFTTSISQIAQGLRDSPLAQLQRTLTGANFMRGIQRPAMAAASPTSFSALESGSLAAYQQRVRGMQQHLKPIEEKQLKEAEKQTGFLKTIAGKFNNFVAEGGT